jgi:peptidylprolyl isomerase
MKNISIGVIVIFLLGAIMTSGCSAAPSAGQAKNGNTVQVNYTGKLADGSVFDSSVGGNPLEFTLGKDQVIPGFEKAIMGMKIGEKKTVTIPANEAYGPSRADFIFEVPREKLNLVTDPQIGQQLKSTQNDGSIITAIITKITDTTVTVDANHRLAGKDLTFDLELLKIL